MSTTRVFDFRYGASLPMGAQLVGSKGVALSAGASVNKLFSKESASKGGHYNLLVPRTNYISLTSKCSR